MKTKLIAIGFKQSLLNNPKIDFPVEVEDESKDCYLIKDLNISILKEALVVKESPTTYTISVYHPQTESKRKLFKAIDGSSFIPVKFELYKWLHENFKYVEANNREIVSLLGEVNVLGNSISVTITPNSPMFCTIKFLMI